MDGLILNGLLLGIWVQLVYCSLGWRLGKLAKVKLDIEGDIKLKLGCSISIEKLRTNYDF